VKTQSSSSVRTKRAARALLAGEQRQVGGEQDFARAELFERAGHFGGSISVTRNSPVETSTWATAERGAARATAAR
jgi:hypothetical protein